MCVFAEPAGLKDGNTLFRTYRNAYFCFEV